jgi:2-polyprenyl-3-methyl-5-hydroxy-6-metoxy-1,4-benzoquinol methylase
MGITEQAKRVAQATGLYRPIRQLIGSKETKLARARMRQFISGLLPNGSLVFDIGANIGSFSEIYAQAGCHVVAVEPNPESVERLRLLTTGLSVQVLESCCRCGVRSSEPTYRR